MNSSSNKSKFKERHEGCLVLEGIVEGISLWQDHNGIEAIRIKPNNLDSICPELCQRYFLHFEADPNKIQCCFIPGDEIEACVTLRSGSKSDYVIHALYNKTINSVIDPYLKKQEPGIHQKSKEKP